MRVKHVLRQSRLLLNLSLLLLFCVWWIHDFLYWILRDAFGTSLNYWAYTDWLIDYSQGFIRRGLSGEIFRLVHPAILPIEFVAFFSWFLILLAGFGYVRLLARSLKTIHPLTLFGLLFLPSLFIFYLHDHSGIARKEILGYISVLLHLLIIEKTFPLDNGTALPAGKLRRYVGWLFPISALLLPAIILVHEGNFLFFVPLHGMITLTVLWTKFRSKFLRAALWTALLYLPAVAAFGAVYLSGTPTYQRLLGICEKWVTVGAIWEGTCILPPDKLSGSTLPGSFNPMQWTLSNAVNNTRFIIGMNWKAWIVILPTLGIMLWYLGRQALYANLRSRFPQSFSPYTARRFTGIFYFKFFLIPFLLSLPVYFNAFDYGRWFTVICVNYAMLVVSLNLISIDYIHSKMGADETSMTVNSPDHLDDRLVFYGVSIAICILVLVLWLPHYCLLSCEIIRSPLEFLSYTFYAH